jgi:hypothetical protein
MFKRVAIVFTLLFAHSALAQASTETLGAISSEQSNLDSPVVAVSGATGTTTQEALTSTSVSSTTSPAEMATTTSTSAQRASSAVTENGALGTSSATTVSTTTLVDETEEDTETSAAQVRTVEQAQVREQKLFDLVYGGFEEFVRVTFGWQ